MRVLVTGARGFLGSHLVDYLLRGLHGLGEVAVLALDRPAESRDRLREVLEAAGDEARRVQVVDGDLSDPLAGEVARELASVDYVLHAALDARAGTADPLPLLRANVVGTHHLLWAVRGAPRVARVFLVSTDEVYGPAPPEGAGTPVDRRPARRRDGRAEFYPTTPYAASAAGAEAVAMSYAHSFGVPLTIVNSASLVGERADPEDLLPTTIRCLVDHRAVPVQSDPALARLAARRYLHCRVLADALCWLAEMDQRHRGQVDQLLGAVAQAGGATVRFAGNYWPRLPARVQVCGEREVSDLDLARLVSRCVDLPLHYQVVSRHPTRPRRDLRRVADDDLIRQMGWVRPADLDRCLEDTVQWYLAHPEWLEVPQDAAR